MPKKVIVEIDRCELCPWFDIDPNDHDTPADRWGMPSCHHPKIQFRLVSEWQNNVPDWCPLPDAAQEDVP